MLPPVAEAIAQAGTRCRPEVVAEVERDWLSRARGMRLQVFIGKFGMTAGTASLAGELQADKMVATWMLPPAAKSDEKEGNSLGMAVASVGSGRDGKASGSLKTGG